MKDESNGQDDCSCGDDAVSDGVRDGGKGIRSGVRSGDGVCAENCAV